MKRYAVACIFVAAGCSVGGGSGAPSNYNEEITREFNVFVGETQGKVRAFTGLDGGKTPSSPTDRGFGAFYKLYRVDLTRIPRGSGCEATLDALCPDPDFGVTKGSPCQFFWDPLDLALDDARTNGMTVIWQAMFDVGKGACVPGGGAERAAGTIQSPDTWTMAVVDVVRHVTASQVNLKYVEFLPDAFGAGGYQDAQALQLMNLYVPFAKKLRLELGEGAPPLAAPSFAVASVADVDGPGRPFWEFLDEVAADANAAPDVLSLASLSSTPEERLDLWKDVRAALGGRGMGDVELADLGARISSSTWVELEPRQDTIEARSAFLGAYMAVWRILAQEILDALVLDRWGGPPIDESGLEREDLFVLDGKPLPALQAMMPFHLMGASGGTRLRTEFQDSGDATDGHGVGAMAAVTDSGGLMAVVAAADPERLGGHLVARMVFHDVPGGDGDAWEMRRAVVDSGSTGFAYQESATLYTVDGTITVVREVGVPSVMYLELSRKEPHVPDDAGAADAE